MITARTLSGHSMPLNVLFVLMNLAGLAFTVMGFHDSFTAYKWLFASIGIGVMLLSTAGLIIFKGRLLIATISRVLVGSLFIVSGLIKANDPVGFSYKLEEYFEDGALAYRIKEWFGAPGFSLEFLVQWALVISIVICVVEIILGVLVLIGGKSKLTSWLLVIMMCFFTFLTWHTASCDSKHRFADRDTYALTNPIAQAKIDASKTNKDIRIVSRTSTEVVVEEMRTPQCVKDCGCFGDALKGSVGRSLTPSESLWKDIVLLYLVVWIFAARRIIRPNSVRQNWIIVPVSLILVSFFCWVFNWYFPLLFAAVTLMTALWIYRVGGRIFGNHYGSALMVTLWSGVFVWYVLRFDPLKDYRPYAVGSNLYWKTLDGKEGVTVTMISYKNRHTGKIKSFDAAGSAYANSNIWDNKDWKQLEMTQEEIVPSRLPSITGDFNPVLPIDAVTEIESSWSVVAEQLKGAETTGLRLREITSGVITEIPQLAYNVESYPAEHYQIVDTISIANPDLTEVSIRDAVLKGEKMLVVVAKRLNEMDKSVIPQLIRLQRSAQKAGIPIVLITSADSDQIRNFRKKYGLRIPTFINDETELKIVSRSNPSLVVLRKGVVLGKYTRSVIPDFNWIQNNLYNKK